MTIYDVIRVMDDTFIRVFGSHDNELFHFWSCIPALEIELEIGSLPEYKRKMITDRKITWIERTDKGLDIYIEDGE